MDKALIVYASLTGNTEEVANIIADCLEAPNWQVKIEECTQVYASDFLDYDLCIVGTYTWGRDGDLPDEIVQFYEDLSQLDLSNKIYGVFGTGEEFYGNFCKSVDDFDRLFQSIHATKGAASVKVELNPQEEDIVGIKKFAQALKENFLIKAKN